MKELLSRFAARCGDVETALIDCEGGDAWSIVEVALDVLMVLVGAAAVIGVVVSGIQYTTSAGNPAAMTKAKKRIIEIVIGLLAYGLMYVFIRWLIPGFSI